MDIKMFELRDRQTHIPIMCIKPITTNEREALILLRGGYGGDAESHKNYVFLMDIQCPSRCHYDSFSWSDRTFFNGHKHIKENWDALSTGDVIDVEYILGETDSPKQTELGVPWHERTII